MERTPLNITLIGMRYRLRHGNTKPFLNNTDFRYLDIGLEIRYKSEEKMQNMEGIGCNLPNVLSRVLRVKDMLQRGVKSIVIPEGGLLIEYIIAKLLDRTYILKQPVQVGSWPGWRW